MKKRTRFLLVWISLTYLVGIPSITSPLRSQTAAAQAPSPVPAPTAWQITTRGANRRTWERVVYERAPGGEIVARNRSYQELASGLCYQDARGNWQDSQEQIDASSFGATAAQGQYHTSFGNNLNSSGVIDQQTGDGKRLRSNILGLAYYDSASGQTVMIAQIQDSQGEFISANQVLYPNAFSGVKADVRYTYKRGTFEQDVILREQPATPESLGLNPDTTEIEVVTEFINPPPTDIIERHSKYNSLPDEAISWGAARLGHGRAFDLGEKRGPQNEVQVRRQFITVNGRNVLIEAVPYQKIQSSLASLPTQSSIARQSHLIAGRTLTLPPKPLAAKNAGPIKIAAAQPLSRGFVLDYVQINANETNFTFQGDSTYLVTGEFDLLGTTTIEGGAVIKMNSGGQLDIDAGGSVVCQTGPYRPTVFTSINDNTVGQPVSGSSGTPTSGDVEIFVELNVTNAVLSNLRFAYCIAGIYQPVYPAGFDLWDSQFLDVDLAIYSGSPRLHNVLIGNAGSEGDSAIFVEGPAFAAENVTADNGYALLELDYWGTNVVALTNCLITRQNLAIAPFPPQYFTNTSVLLPSLSAPVYKPVGGAQYYLTNNSPYHNSGTRSVSANLITDLAGKTTYPPVVYSNVSFTLSTNLSPQAVRDNTGNPDLGYHYDPLDFVFGGVNVYSNINFTAGTAVGWFNGGSGVGIGISLHGKAQASFSGTAVQPCVFARNDMAQEGVNGIWTTQSYLGGIVGYGGNYTQATAPTVNFDFTRCFSRNFEGNVYRDSGDGTLIVINADNTEFYDGGGGAYLVYINFTNCLSVRNNVVASCNCSPHVSLVNCTFIGGSLTAERQSGATWPMVVQDCAFQGTSFTINDPSGGNTNITWCNFNSFLTTDSLPAGQGSHYLTVTNYNWQTGWFGNYYLPANSPLIQQGSTTANKLGLYHFTTQVSEVPETNSVVDIGYHYVATDGYGNPLDGNGDGLPDYLEDINGNGVDDTGEIPWDVAIVTQPTNLTVNAGSTATFAVVTGGNSPVSYQWKFDGTNIPGATAPTYSITNTSATNLGVYSVILTGISGFNLSSSNAILSLYSELSYWRFDNTNTWAGDQGQVPLLVTNAVGVPSWDTNAVQIDSTNEVILSYRVVETNGNINLTLPSGTISFWFKPDWTSSNSFGTGPGSNGRLIEVGNYNPIIATNTGLVYFTNGWWSLFLTPDGDQLVFASSTNGGYQINLDSLTTFTSNQWCQIVLTYTHTNCLLYLNSQLLTNGLGSIYLPNKSEQSGGFRIGSDAEGNNQARGVFDDLATFNYALDPGTISTVYQTDITLDSANDGLSNILANELGLNPYVYNSLYSLNSSNQFQVFTPLK